MPRYRFDWDNLPHALIRRLASDLQLGGDPAKALRKAYGARPDEDFVRDAWPSLLDHWVSKNPALRHSLVTGLQSLGLGQAEAKLSSARAEATYLRSCRNSPRLRGLVLAHLITAGEEPPAPKHVANHRTPATPAARRGPAGWAQLEKELTGAISELDQGQYIIISDRRRPDYYVQVAQGGPEGLRAEAVSNAFLTPEEQLDADAIRSLSKLGWTDPDPEKSFPNYFRDWETPVPYSDVSSLMVRTLSEVLAAPSPNVLRYRAFAKGGPEIIIPTLGIIREPLHTDRRTEVSQPTTASSPEELLDQVKAVMKPILGTEEVLTDEEGDIPVRYGNVMVYVRVSKDQPLVRVFSPVVWDIGSPSDILETVNEMNGEMLFARAQWNGTGVTLSSDVMGAPLESDQLQRAYSAICQLADEYAGRLQERYGGRIAFGEALPAKRDEHLGGYL